MNPHLVNMLAYFGFAVLCLVVYLTARWVEGRNW